MIDFEELEVLLQEAVNKINNQNKKLRRWRYLGREIAQLPLPLVLRMELEELMGEWL